MIIYNLKILCKYVFLINICRNFTKFFYLNIFTYLILFLFKIIQKHDENTGNLNGSALTLVFIYTKYENTRHKNILMGLENI